MELLNLLGLDSSASDEQIENEYARLASVYGEQRFLEGEAGTEGARKLSDLTEAYRLYKLQRAYTEQQPAYTYNAFSNADYTQINVADESKNAISFEQIDAMIKNGEYDRAQAAMDSMSERGAEWHYMQSIIFYRREWMTECRKQLEMAVSIEPNNIKYRNALDKLKIVMASPNINPQMLGNGEAPQQGKGVFGGNELCDCCAAYLIVDCCCSMLRCM